MTFYKSFFFASWILIRLPWSAQRPQNFQCFGVVGLQLCVYARLAGGAAYVVAGGHNAHHLPRALLIFADEAAARVARARVHTALHEPGAHHLLRHERRAVHLRRAAEVVRHNGHLGAAQAGRRNFAERRDAPAGNDALLAHRRRRVLGPDQTGRTNLTKARTAGSERRYETVARSAGSERRYEYGHDRNSRYRQAGRKRQQRQRAVRSLRSNRLRTRLAGRPAYQAGGSHSVWDGRDTWHQTRETSYQTRGI